MEKVSYGNESRWMKIRSYMDKHFRDIIKNIQLSDITIWKGVRVDVRDLIYERIAYVLCYNELKKSKAYKQYYDEDVRRFGNVPSQIQMLESCADAIETAYNNVLDNECVIIAFQNQIDELAEIPKTYSDEESTIAMIKNFFKNIGTEMILNKMEELGKQL